MTETPTQQPTEPHAPAESWMGEDIDLRQYLDVLLRRRRIIIACVAMALVSGLFTSLSTTPVYEASTTIQIERESRNFLDFEAMWQVYVTENSYYQTQYRLIQSRALAQRVVDREGLLDDPSITAPPASAPGPVARGWRFVRSLPSLVLSEVRGLFGTEARSASEEEILAIENEDPRYTRAINKVLSGLSVEPIQNTQLVRVVWRGPDPAEAARMANAVSNAYIDMHLEAKYQATNQANEFLTTEIVKLRDEIADLQAELQEYGSERDILSMNERQDTVTQGLTELNAEYTQAQTQRVQKETLYEQLQESEPDSLPQVFTNEIVVQLTSQLANLQQRRVEVGQQFTDQHPQMKRLQAQIDDLQQRVESEQNRIYEGLVTNARQEYQIARDREQRLKSLLDQQKLDTQQLNRDLITYRNLQIAIDNKTELLDTLLQRQSEAGVSARLQGVGTSSIRIVDPAPVPRSPTSPNTSQNLMYAALIGLVLGVGLAFFTEHLDNSLKSSEEVEEKLGLPALAWVPAMASGNGVVLRVYGGGSNKPLVSDGSVTPELISAKQPSSQVAESYRTLRTAILLSRAGRPPRTLVVTSARPGEGKTTSALNLAVSMAQAGKKVLLVDADMRRPRLHRLLELDDRRGLSHYLTGTQGFEDVVQKTGVHGLEAIVCGPRPPNPAELLSSQRDTELLRRAAEEYDMVILDTPPVMAVSDPLVLAAAADGVLLVVRGGETPYQQVKQANKKLAEVGGKVVGVLLNNVQPDGLGRYDGYEDYGAYVEEPVEGEPMPEPSVPRYDRTAREKEETRDVRAS